ncbi:MAG: fluoride efflux transporter CrcB [Deltaproteobacteria bacterium]|nr:fluoride efflux transporter CrcB [Deltaproteobacteria bacterium]
MIKEILLVGAGSFLGGVARYLIALAMKGIHTVLPWATLTANIAGCFLIGVFWALFCRGFSNSSMHLFLAVGFCGGFTTFSTFSRESVLLLQSGNYTASILYVVGSAVFGIFAVMAGFVLAK